MEWILLTTLWPLFADWSFANESVPWPETEPASTDLFLTRLTYEFVAAETACVTCRSPLGRDLRLLVTPGRPSPARRIVVVSRCHGWRRHRYAASVTQLRDGLHFNPLGRA
jgi:hypothetical protein